MTIDNDLMHKEYDLSETPPTLNAFKDSSKITKTEKTKKAYINRAVLLLKKVGKLYNQDETIVDPRQAVIWLKRNSKNFTKNTFRQYKSALIFYFIHELKSSVALEAAEYLATLSSEPCPEKSSKTSSKKSKHLNKTKYEKLLSYLLTRNNKYDQYLICWLQAGLLTGLRPFEWLSVALVDYNGQLALNIKNAKNTNGRANGDTRLLLLTGMSEMEINIIKQQIYNIQSNAYDDHSYNQFYSSCANSLAKANQELFGKGKKNITLYSARHQFSANAKAANVGRDALAALMGHATEETAATHYGKKRFGSGTGVKVEPIQEQVETVKKYDFTFINNKMQAIFEKSRAEKMAEQFKEQQLPLFDEHDGYIEHDIKSEINNETNNSAKRKI